MPYSAAIYQWEKKKKSRLFPPVVWAQKWPVRSRRTPRQAVGWGWALGMSSPTKSYGHRSCCLSSRKLLANPIPGKGWGQILVQEWRGVATPARRLRRGIGTGQEGGNPGQIQLLEPLGLGTLLSTMKHQCTPSPSPARPHSDKDTRSQVLSKLFG